MSEQEFRPLNRATITWIAATLLMLRAFSKGHIIAYNSFLNVTWSEGFRTSYSQAMSILVGCRN